MTEGGFRQVVDRLPPFLAGVSVGLLAAWIITRPRSPAPALPVADSPEGSASWTRWSEAWDEALETLALARERLLGGDVVLDLDALRARLETVQGGEDVQIRDLRGGIVEVLGSAADEETVARILETLSGSPGVSVVVNRVWTPSSLGPPPQTAIPG